MCLIPQLPEIRRESSRLQPWRVSNSRFLRSF